MIRLLLILLGAQLVRRRWPVLAGAAAVWVGLGAFIFLDALDNSMLIPVWGLGYLLLMEGALSLVVAAGSVGVARRMRLVKGFGLLLVGFLSIEASGAAGDIALALLIGLTFMADGALKIAAARVVRFQAWQRSQALGGLSLVLAVFTLQPWPTWYVGTIGCNVGIALVLSGVGAMVLAGRLRRLPPGAPMAALLYPSTAFPHPSPDPDAGGCPVPLIVYVWTPLGAAGPDKRQSGRTGRLLVERYIAAVDGNGTVSTGHAALELAPDLYISHYPATEIERSPGSFGKILRATADNDTPGLFKPSYAMEAAEWCQATSQVQFTRHDPVRLRAFWDGYRRNETYNLSSRNCSSAVAAALDAALEGVLCATPITPPVPWRAVVRAIWSPELWAASMLRRRAETMAWTPGLVLDYARALSAVIDPPEPRWRPALDRAIGRRLPIRPAASPLDARPLSGPPPKTNE